MFVQLLNIFPVLLPLKPRRWFICFYNICTIWIILNPVNGARVHRDGPPVFSLTLLVIPELLIEFMTFLFFFSFPPRFKPGNKDFRWSLVYSFNLPFFPGTKGTGLLLISIILVLMFTVASSGLHLLIYVPCHLDEFWGTLGTRPPSGVSSAGLIWYIASTNPISPARFGTEGKDSL